MRKIGALVFVFILLLLFFYCVFIKILKEETLVFERYYTRSILKRWIGFRLRENDRQKLLDVYWHGYKRVAGMLTEEHLKYFVYPLYQNEEYEVLEKLFQDWCAGPESKFYSRLKFAGYADGSLDETYSELRNEYLEFVKNKKD